MSGIPSGAAVEKLGGAVENLLGAFLGKMNDAEANTQYKAAYESLRKSTIDFNNSLATDPNPENYVEKWGKAKDQIWKNSTRMVKNQDALNALTDTWQNMDIDQYKAVSGIQTQARVEGTVDTAVNTSNNISQDNTISNDARKAKLREIWAPIKAAGMRKPETVDKYLESMDKAVDQSSMEEGLRQIGRTKGFDYALGLVDNPDFTKYFPTLTPKDRDVVRTKMEQEVTIGEKKDTRTNDATEEPLAKEFSSVMENDTDPSKLKQLIDGAKDKWVGKEKAARDEKWALRFHEIVGAMRGDRRAAEADNPIADSLRIDAQNEMIEPGVTLDNARDALSKKEITWLQFKSVQSAVSPRVKAMALPFEAIFKTDTGMDQKVKDAMTLAASTFRSWIGNNMGAPEAEMKKKSDSLHADALKGIVRDSANEAFAGRRIVISAEAAGTTVPPKYAGGHPPDKSAPPQKEQGPAGVVTHYYGKAKSGETILRDDAGVYYTQDKGGRWIFSKDGKTWQVQ